MRFHQAASLDFCPKAGWLMSGSPFQQTQKTDSGLFLIMLNRFDVRMAFNRYEVYE